MRQGPHAASLHNRLRPQLASEVRPAALTRTRRKAAHLKTSQRRATRPIKSCNCALKGESGVSPRNAHLKHHQSITENIHQEACCWINSDSLDAKLEMIRREIERMRVSQGSTGLLKRLGKPARKNTRKEAR